MPFIALGPGNRCVIDGVEVTDMVAGYRLEVSGSDVPMLLVELHPGLMQEETVFAGVANIRVAQDGPSIGEFLDAIDVAELERVALEADVDTNPIAAALDALKAMASVVR